MTLKVVSPAAPGEAEGTFRLVLLTEDRAPADAALLSVREVDGLFEVAGCPHVHPTYEEALECPEARVALGDIAGTPLPDVED